jgi:hypothetical protein
MSFVITAADRASFRRCRRQWDFAAGTRQNLEPRQPPAAVDLDRALRDALAVYYYPGMWDWDRGVRLPLVVQGLERALTRPREQRHDDADAGRWHEQLETGRSLLARYFEWAPTADRFAPVLAEADYEVTVLDPARPSAGLVTGAGEPVRYRGRVDLMAVDGQDAYWIVRHRLVDGDWPPTDQLVADEETLTACWAWEQFYIGMAITGIVWNEIRCPSPSRPPPSRPPFARARLRQVMSWPRLRRRPAGPPPAVREHEPSGGGRSIPQHRRMYAQARAPRRIDPIEQHVAGEFRRTWLRCSPADVAQAGRRLGADAAEMIRQHPNVDPSPSDQHCPACPYLGPCLALSSGQDAGPILLSGYRQRPPEGPVEGRLGGGAWSTGRGAAPPKFRGGQRG